jgi:hypothetical protein
MTKEGVANARNTQVLLKKDGTTADIITAVLDTVGEVKSQTKGFSENFVPTRAGLQRLWSWVKNNIHYNEDPLGVQWIREPARLYQDREGDCKSFTVFIVSVLENIGVPYFIRFSNTEQAGKKIVNHVYPVAILNGQEVIMDAVYTAFDREANFFYAKDYSMSEIYRLSGIGAASAESLDQYTLQLQELSASISSDVLINDITEMTSGEFSRFMSAANFDALSEGAQDAGTAARYSSAAMAIRQGSIAGVGNLGGDASKIQKFLAETANNTEKAFKAPQVNLPSNMTGVGSIRSKVRNVLDTIKEAWKKLINWIFKQALPTVSPFFLYAFIKKSVGKKTDAKKQKALNLINWIQNTGSFETADAVMSSIKVGISKKFGKPVETVLNDMAKGKNIAGIGAVTAVLTAIATLIPLIKELIQKIASLFKKNKNETPDVSNSDLPDENELAAELAASGEKTIKVDPDPSGSGGKGDIMKYAIPVLLGGAVIYAMK